MDNLALKHRPLRFKSLVGQELSQRVFLELIRRGQIGRNIILHGPFGSSKTTTCRIYARALNCTDPQDGEPCNQCDNCVAFLEDRYTDYTEYDGASQGQKENVAELVKIAKQPPLYGRYRVINIDECQGMSNQAWDRLLKILEEPPPYLVFIFTTTEFNKVREAVVSRCQTIEVRLLSHAASLEHLERVCTSEGIEYDPKGLELISWMSKGHPRDLLKNLEQTILLGGAQAENVKRMFQLQEVETGSSVIRAIMGGDLEKAINLNRGWNLSPREKMEVIRELFVWLYLSHTKGLKVSISNNIQFISQEELAELIRGVTKVCQESHKTLEEGVNYLLMSVEDDYPESDMSLEVRLIHLYRLCHVQSLDSGKMGQPQVQSRVSGKGVKRAANGRRVFSQNYRPEVEEAPAEANDELQEKRTEEVYDHTLQEFGFVPEGDPKDVISL